MNGTTNGLYNGVVHIRCQAIAWTNIDQGIVFTVSLLHIIYELCR